MAGIYFHIPFCSSICQYCDFFVTTKRKPEMQEKYVGGILSELEFYSSSQIEFKTIYFGGGTPSLLKVSLLEKILEKIYKNFRVVSNPEITIEVNPKEVSFQNFLAYRKLGINRLSIGTQSFVENELKFLTRLHNKNDAENCFNEARKANFQNVSLDLIFGLQNQTLESWEQSLQKTVELNPEHISLYGLTFYEGTKFTRKLEKGKIQKISEDAELEFYLKAIEVFTKNGFEHYEVSSFAKPNFRSKHNSSYWNHAEYLGIGASAHSFWNGKRFWNFANLEKYFENISKFGNGIEEEEKITTETLELEKLMLGLRQKEGVFWDNFEALEKIPKEFYKIKENNLRLTPKGFAMYDSISEKLASYL